MRRIIGVLFVLLSMLGVAIPLSAQDTGGAGSTGQQASGFHLQQNYPNPFNPETTIPFVLGEDLFADGRPVVVTVRIYNLFLQEVAVPTPKNHPMGATPQGVIEYTQPGTYEMFWDGKDQNDREVASGVYFVVLTVNGSAKMMKMFVAK